MHTIYIRIHTHTNIRICSYKNTYIHIYIHTYIQVRIRAIRGFDGFTIHSANSTWKYRSSDFAFGTCIYDICIYMCLCVYVSTHVCIDWETPKFRFCIRYICVYACMCLCMYVWIIVYLYAMDSKHRSSDFAFGICIYVYMHICVYACMYRLLYMCMHSSDYGFTIHSANSTWKHRSSAFAFGICIYVYMYIFVYACMYRLLYMCMFDSDYGYGMILYACRHLHTHTHTCTHTHTHVHQAISD
jgi:hypothetical protein